MGEFTLDPIGGYIWVTILIGLLVVPAVLVRPPASASHRRQGVLLALRAVAILLILIAMLRPALTYTETNKQSATLILLADRSRSMMVTDAFGGKSRWQDVQSQFEAAAPVLRELAQFFEIKWYAFDSEAQPLEREADSMLQELEPLGDQTAIGAVLEDVVRREANKRVAGIILLSDGAQRAIAPRDSPPQAAARRLADFGYPLYTLSFGQARGLGQARDVALRDLIANPSVFVKNQLDVQGTLGIQGYANRPVTVQLLFETSAGSMAVVDSVELTAAQEGERIPVELSHVPEEPGEYKMTLQTIAQEGELVTTNNHLSTFVTVLDRGIRVFYMEGAIRPEQRYIRLALDASPDIELDVRPIDSHRRDSWSWNLSDSLQPGRYDVYLIGDLDSEALRDDNWDVLAEAVEKGAGLMMIGGLHSFGPGGYQETALRAVLPIKMHRLERQRFGEATQTDLHWTGPVRMRPVDRGLAHSILHLAPDRQNTDVWDQLPPLDGANRFLDAKRTAHILAESDQGKPLLVAGTWRDGRVLAFAGDSTWKWSLAGYAQDHKRFWRQVVLWLAKMDETTQGPVWVQMERRRYLPGSRVQFTAGARNDQGDPIAGATYRAQITLPDGEHRNVPLTRPADTVTGTLAEVRVAGDYTVEVTAFDRGETLGTAQARFLVSPQDLELDNPAADPGLLQSLAQITKEFGGQARSSEEFVDLLEEIRANPREWEVQRQIRQTYWDTWPFFLFFVAVMGTEWYLRKKWGMV